MFGEESHPSYTGTRCVGMRGFFLRCLHVIITEFSIERYPQYLKKKKQD
jgi:hypothetical protein